MRVAVIDTGIDSEHPAFQDTNFFIVRDMETTSRDGQGIIVDPANPTGLGIPVNPNDSVDYTGHGTKVAGVIAAANVSSRTQGVAYEAEVVSLKVQHLTDVRDTIYTGAAAPNENLSFPLELLTETALIDAILTWEGEGNWWLRVQSPAPAFFQTDQSAGNFAACTNIPLQVERGGWNVYATNMRSDVVIPFTLTVRQWVWTIPDDVMIRTFFHAINQKANVINVSLSLGDYYDALYEEAKDENVIVVAAVGNIPPDNTPSAWNRHAIIVGATDPNDILADFSTHGPAPDGNTKPDVVAPGVSNMVVESRYRLTAHDMFTQASGTSIAAPHVAGGAALLVQYLTEMTGETPSAPLVKTLLMGSAVTVGIGIPPVIPGAIKDCKDNASGAGRIDLYRALTSFGATGVVRPADEGVIKRDRLKFHTPVVLPNDPSLNPLRATLYWDEAIFEAFRILDNGIVGFTYVSDTAMTKLHYNPPGTSDFYILRVQDPRIMEDEVWQLAIPHPPLRQTLEGGPYGYFFTDTVWVPGTTQYTITVPLPQVNAALRILTYQTDNADVTLLFLNDPGGTTRDTFALSEVAVKQVVSSLAPMGGNWTLQVYNMSGKTLSATMVSNYPFDFSLPYHVYLPVVVKEQALLP